MFKRRRQSAGRADYSRISRTLFAFPRRRLVPFEDPRIAEGSSGVSDPAADGGRVAASMQS